ncbi:MAG: hypothetical protein CMI14_04445 [Oleispira sp.]|nr:hypothetical protein [Oleispira sp.]|tara:strand:- start:570 stop:1259 length:690 start_codon:yes stop_codon:yes gene_type:complete
MNDVDLNDIDMNDIEKLSAYIDNELSPADRAELEQKLVVDSELKQVLSKLEQSNIIAKTYFSELDRKPLPMNLETMILNAKPQPKTVTIVDFFRRKAANNAMQNWSFASAASIVFALGIWMLMPLSESNINASLVSVLNTQPSGSVTTVNPELKIEVLASYKNVQGSVCRSIIQHSPQSSNPILACFNNGEWSVDATDFSKQYQTASIVDLTTNAELMTAEQERAWLTK